MSVLEDVECSKQSIFHLLFIFLIQSTYN